MSKIFYYNNTQTLELLALPIIEQGYITLDYEDLRSLFQGYLVDAVCVEADSEEKDRIRKMMDNLKMSLNDKGTAHEPSALCLVFFSPQEAPLQMNELEDINQWLDSFCTNECEIRWGVYKADTDRLSVIVMMRRDPQIHEYAITEEEFLAFARKRKGSHVGKPDDDGRCP